MRVTVYGKPGCHLCEEVMPVIERLRGEYGFVLEEIDVTRDAELQERYRYQIPVICVDGREAFRYRVDEQEFMRLLDEARR
ncbi:MULTISPECIES: glutaredoxin family protein [Prosthecochloris]|uniref:Glutaredoxin family protein n=1 Tax=Prosthecochloris vibrioformis TaxID=1098 RepID=A0A5C4S1H8_PROVB|nr:MULTISPECIES: glutaredoxin family protein [Prosthecochloris]TNJ36611.1 glutaredoxin family protein [Prosthecochloris vibrioformis]